LERSNSGDKKPSTFIWRQGRGPRCALIGRDAGDADCQNYFSFLAVIVHACFLTAIFGEVVLKAPPTSELDPNLGPVVKVCGAGVHPQPDLRLEEAGAR